MVKPRQLGHVVLRVRDVERSKAFYTYVLGLEVTFEAPEATAFMSAGEASHELAVMALEPNAPGLDSSRVGLYHFARDMEAFYELPRDQWPADGNIFGGAFPLEDLHEEPAAAANSP